VKLNGVNRKGYAAADFHDAWKRYVGGGSKISATSATSATNLINKDKKVAEVALVAHVLGEDADDAKVAREERAAVLEYDGGLDRQEAEEAAAEELGWPELPEFLRREEDTS
jgi:hypothetical protein